MRLYPVELMLNLFHFVSREGTKAFMHGTPLILTQELLVISTNVEALFLNHLVVVMTLQRLLTPLKTVGLTR